MIDTHAHYDDKAYDEDREELLLGLKDNDIELVVNASAEMRECKATLEMINKYPFVYGMLGIHPSCVDELDDEKLEWIKKEAKDNAVCKGGKIVAIGEIGLDYYEPDISRELQKEWFVKQLLVAIELNMPVNIHSRDACEDTLTIMKEYYDKLPGGIIHCYSYSVETAREYLNMGFKFGIGGVVTFKNAKKLVEVVDMLPMEAIVLETDAPYLAPMPFRGKRNTSSYLEYVVEKIAQIKGISIEEVKRITNENSRKVYGLNANA